MSDAGALLEPDDVRLLVDIGFMALSRGLDGPAAAIFAGVAAARPAQEAGPIGTALVQLHRGEVEAAVRGLRALPPSDAARLFLGLALGRQGAAAEARAVLADVAATATDPAHARSAQAMLEAAESAA
jgi:hypothetical protein